MYTRPLVLASLLFSVVSAIPLSRRGVDAATALSNGQLAQKQNSQFATLSADSSCTSGTNACVQGQFAQCANGKFAVTSCAAGTQCLSLPLVNSAGTSITCATEADAAQRIAATGATGGVTGSGSTAAVAQAPAASSSTSSTAPAAAAAPEKNAAAATSSSGSKSFSLSNGHQAQSENAQFATLSATSSCTNGKEACVGGKFAQCVGSTFATTACAGGTQCFSLPLVNSAGTSITCATEADASSRIAATGATGGVDGAQ